MSKSTTPAASRSQTFELLSPCFCAGADEGRPELRVPSVRGQLRWWLRVLEGCGKPEYTVFGGAFGKRVGLSEDPVASAFRFSLAAHGHNQSPSVFYTIPHKEVLQNYQSKGYLAKALPPGDVFTLRWQPQPHPSFKTQAKVEEQARLLERCLKAWLLLGTIGRRATRAMGSVWPSGFEPSIEDFTLHVGELDLPPTLRWAILTPEPKSREELLRAAGETVHGLRKDDFPDNPFGFVARNERKASPLRFKVGRFKDGLRLIAIWDRRHHLGGDLASALAAAPPGKNVSQPLRDWLSNSTLLQLSTASPGANPAATPATSESVGNEVENLLSGKFDFNDIKSGGRFQEAVERWKSAGQADLVAAFREQTAQRKFLGLRAQQWYKNCFGGC